MRAIGPASRSSRSRTSEGSAPAGNLRGRQGPGTAADRILELAAGATPTDAMEVATVEDVRTLRQHLAAFLAEPEKIESVYPDWDLWGDLAPWARVAAKPDTAETARSVPSFRASRPFARLLALLATPTRPDTSSTRSFWRTRGRSRPRPPMGAAATASGAGGPAVGEVVVSAARTLAHWRSRGGGGAGGPAPPGFYRSATSRPCRGARRAAR